jgi:Dimerisation domain
MFQQLDPTSIMQTATSFWASKVLLTAVEFDLFSTIGDGSMTAAQLGAALGLHPRGRYDFFDALVALGFLHRDGDGPAGRYRNTPETAAFLVKQSPAYIGGMPEMFNSRLFGFWNNLGEALRTGKPQNEIKLTGKPMFAELYADEARLGEFLRAMTGLQAGNSVYWPSDSTSRGIGLSPTLAGRSHCCRAWSRRAIRISALRRSIFHR